jgi:ABC-2 type transport system permease protein
LDRLRALVALRWRTELRNLLGARERAVGVALVLPGLLLASLFGSFVAWFAIRSVSAHRPELLLPLLSILVTGVGCFWMLSPLMAGFAFSETHDVSRLLHVPVPLGTLVASSLVANLAQPAVIAELPVLLAASLALSATRLSAFPAVLFCVALSFAFILAAAQLAGLAFQGVARSRRLQDAALVVGLALGLLLSLAPLLLLMLGGGLLGPLAGPLLERDLFALSPFAWGLRAAVHVSRGEPVAALGFAAGGGVAIAAAMAGSAALIERVHRGELRLSASRKAGAPPARMRFSGELGALLEKDLRIAWREPALKASLVLGLVGPLVLLYILTRGIAPGGSAATLLLLATAIGLTSFGTNAFGLERRGVMLLLSFPVPRWKVLVAKNTAGLVFRIPGLVTLVAAALILGPLEAVPAALTLTVVMLLFTAGMDNFVSILFPITVPAPGQNPHAAASGGRGLTAALLGMVLLGAAFVVSAPFALLVWLPLMLRSPWLWLGSLPLGLAGAAAGYAMLVAWAAGLLERREPELVGRILGEA